MIKHAIILAGGFGTRLRQAVPDLPKCMAPVLAKPFIGYLFDNLRQQGIEDFTVALGYQHRVVEQYLKTQYAGLSISYTIEEEPLGTGGAVLLACQHLDAPSAVVCNGDTFFKTDLRRLGKFHDSRNSVCTLSLKKVEDGSRYGAVQLNEDHTISKFTEKGNLQPALINGGVYALDIHAYKALMMSGNSSFETDFLLRHVDSGRIYGLEDPGYFIDIGIPQDYERAQTELIQNIDPNA